MAELKTVLDIEVTGGEKLEKAIKSVADYKREIKEAKTLALNGDGEAAKRVAELQDKLEDLGDATKAVKGDGVEPLTNSFSLFKQGLATGDMDKAKLGLKGIGSAMSAIPILLLVEGFRFLAENFQEIIKFGKELFNIFSDEERAVRTLTKELENQKKVTADLAHELNNEIAIMEAQGASHKELLKKKLELIEVQKQEAFITAKLNYAKLQEAINNDNITESIYKTQAALLRKVGLTEQAEAIEKLIQISKYERTKEDKKAVEDSIKLIEDLNTKKIVEQEKYNTEIRNKKKTAKEQEFIDDLNSTNIQSLVQKKVADEEIIQTGLQGVKEKYIQIDNENLNKAEERLRQGRLKSIDEDAQMTEDGLNAAKSLSDVYFGAKLANVKKGSAEEEKILRQQFEVSKKFQIAQAAINGAQAVTAILSVPDFTFGVASALRIGASVAATVATIAKINSTQFQSSSAPSNSIAASIGNISQSNIAPPTNLFNQSTNQPPTTTFTGNNNNNQGTTIKAVVVETDNRQATNRINKLTSEASF